MTEDTNTVDTTTQVLETPAPEKTPVEGSQPDTTLKLDTIFGEMYNSLKDSVQSFITNLSIAGMNAEHSVVHAYQHAKTLVEDYHRTPLNAAQKSVLTAQLLKDATNPVVPIEPPVANSTPIQEQVSTPNLIINNTPETIEAAKALANNPDLFTLTGETAQEQ